MLVSVVEATKLISARLETLFLLLFFDFTIIPFAYIQINLYADRIARYAEGLVA